MVWSLSGPRRAVNPSEPSLYLSAGCRRGGDPRGGVVGMGVREHAGLLGGDFGNDRSDVVEGEREAPESGQVEAAQDTEDDVVADDLDVGQDLPAAVADADQDDAAILRMPDAFDEAML